MLTIPAETEGDARTSRNVASARRVDAAVDTQEQDLEGAIARLTRALAGADDDAIADLVAERRVLRAELEGLRVAGASNVVRLDSTMRRR